MGVAVDILRSWRHPRRMAGKQLALGPREDRALAYLMVACLIIFVSQWPRLIRTSADDPASALDIRLGGALLAWLFLVPLLAYGLAAVAHLVWRLLGGQGTWWRARMALFWSLLAVSPLWLANGLVEGIVGPGVVMQVTGAIALVALVVLWMAAMIEAETKSERGWN